jgi:hypothetical protein
MSDPTSLQDAALSFTDQNHGSLPDKISERDLEVLNQGLRDLFALMRRARRQYEDERDNGRAAAFTALAAFWRFLALFESPASEQLHVPILKLQDALASLDNNLVLSLVQPIPRRGRALSSQAHLSLKGLAAGTVKRLTNAGLRRSDACREVANILKKAGIHPERGSGGLTATTVKNWCVEVASDIGRKHTPALMYHSMFARPEEQVRVALMQKDQARKCALAELEQWVQLVLRPQKTI